MQATNRWKTSISKLHKVNYWKDTELPSFKYTALASYSQIINGKLINKGKCINIDSKDTISNNA